MHSPTHAAARSCFETMAHTAHASLPFPFVPGLVLQLICQRLDPASAIAARSASVALREACSGVPMELKITLPMQSTPWLPAQLDAFERRIIGIYRMLHGKKLTASKIKLCMEGADTWAVSPAACMQDVVAASCHGMQPHPAFPPGAPPRPHRHGSRMRLSCRDRAMACPHTSPSPRRSLWTPAPWQCWQMPGCCRCCRSWASCACWSPQSRAWRWRCRALRRCGMASPCGRSAPTPANARMYAPFEACPFEH